ncbi:MAG: hypothetical protein JXQ82_05845 [Methanomicrobiaceae archaeon]|nr:hypothetical protein [Methanomicrobiaceae archaeon]
MKLPRGRFERFVRDVSIEDVLGELGEKKFTGSCSGMFGEIRGELVFDNGEIILAESGDITGIKALFEIYSSPKSFAEAELSVYTGPQIKLAKEFNSKSLISRDEYISALKSFSAGILPEERGQKTEDTPFSESEESKKEGSDLTFKAIKPEEKQNFEDDLILSINQSEIDLINREFKKSAKDILKRINLDHLIKDEESEEEKK